MEKNGQFNMQRNVTAGRGSVNPLKDMNLMDDFLFDVATVDLETCKIIIELSLGIRLTKIEWKEGQKVVHNLPGKRGIRMDFYVEDDQGQVFDVEMQKRNRGNIPKRTRFYQALIDAPMLKSGEQGFDNLKPAYIIVICGFDLYGYGFYRYTFDNRCEEMPGLLMGDECRKIILNTKGNNADMVEESLVDFLHYIEKSNADNVPPDCDARLKDLHQKLEAIKANEQMGVTYMKMEERDRIIREEGEIKGLAKGEAKIVSMIRKKLAKHKKIQEIAGELELDTDYVEQVIRLLQEDSSRTDEQTAELMLSGK